METENQTPTKKDYSLPISIIAAAVLISASWIYARGDKTTAPPADQTAAAVETILPSEGVVLPIKWGDLGKRLTDLGVIDQNKFEQILAGRGELTDEVKGLLYGSGNGSTTLTTGDSTALAAGDKITMTRQNAGILLNLFWALGLANKNEILTAGPMAEYGNTGEFASTGGWTLARGNAMNHYSMHQLIDLTPEQQKIVEEISKNIYRPCCNNPTHFPDCNHGMAMLGLIELMASQGASKEEIYKTALVVNSYWFPDQYLTIAQYLKSKNIDWSKVSPDKILGSSLSSAGGFARIKAEITTPREQQNQGGGCGV